MCCLNSLCESCVLEKPLSTCLLTLCSLVCSAYRPSYNAGPYTRLPVLRQVDEEKVDSLERELERDGSEMDVDDFGSGEVKGASADEEMAAAGEASDDEEEGSSSSQGKKKGKKAGKGAKGDDSSKSPSKKKKDDDSDGAGATAGKTKTVIIMPMQWALVPWYTKADKKVNDVECWASRLNAFSPHRLVRLCSTRAARPSRAAACSAT